MSQPFAEPGHLPLATEQQVREVRARAADPAELAARRGISRLAFASPGRLRGHVADDQVLFDMFEFQRDPQEPLRAAVSVADDA